MNFRKTGDGAQHNIFYAGLHGSRNRNRIPIATQTCRNPQNMYFLNGWIVLRATTIWR
jgi:hypothetical protein